MEETPMPETPTFGRYAEIPYDRMTPEQQQAYKNLIETRGRLPGPNKIYVHNPKLAKVMGPLGAHFRTGYSLSEREREIAVCIICSKFHAAYPTNAHERAAKAAGLPPDTVEAILAGLPTSFADQRERVVYERCVCLIASRRPAIQRMEGGAGVIVRQNMLMRIPSCRHKGCADLAQPNAVAPPGTDEREVLRHTRMVRLGLHDEGGTIQVGRR
jgi:4-carboxymuconolactone decarboxylase